MPISLVATGGTIASTRGEDGSVTATLGGEELVRGLPELSEFELGVIDLSIPGSWNLTTQLVVGVADAVLGQLRSGSDGVVVTHGTDVLEETAWLLELLVRPHEPERPVVLTASMRHASEFGGDGPRNLYDALRVATDPAAVGRGVMVCVNGELHHARHVVKTHATAVSTFASPGHGPIGEVLERSVRFTGPSPAVTPAVPISLGGPVPVVVSHWDAEGELIDHHLDRGARGIVVEASGAGNVHGPLADGLLRALDAGVPVVVASRCRSGRPEPIYGGSGGFATLHGAGAVAAPGLTAGKARLALQVALADPAVSIGTVHRYFEQIDC